MFAAFLWIACRPQKDFLILVPIVYLLTGFGTWIAGPANMQLSSVGVASALTFAFGPAFKLIHPSDGRLFVSFILSGLVFVAGIITLGLTRSYKTYETLVIVGAVIGVVTTAVFYFWIPFCRRCRGTKEDAADVLEAEGEGCLHSACSACL